MTDRYITQADHRRLKGRLTRALKTSPRKVLDECAYFKAYMADKAYPDDWSRWQRAADDAYFALQHLGQSAERVDLS